MRILIFCLAILNSVCVNAQPIELLDGQYIDTTGQLGAGCKDAGIYYYQVNRKYPLSSDQLLKLLKQKTSNDLGFGASSGWITFQFTIDCEGKLVRRVKLIQSDSKYLPSVFPTEGILKLYEFLLSLHDWKPVVSDIGTGYPYRSFFSFKIIHGKVDRIIP
jgi:hypothetical protein